MKWVKRGLIYNKNATTPTPILLNPHTIRIYAGIRDKNGIGRIGFIDVDSNNPKRILRISAKPVLNVGKPGTFDDNGVILGDVIRYRNVMRMYYVGFQHVQKVKFLAFSGLAISRDNGKSFKRVSDTPVLDRAPDEFYMRAIHSVIKERGVWKIWYGAGNSWEIIKGRPYPKYSIFYNESRDGIHFKEQGLLCIKGAGNEYRMARPRVYKTDYGYEMFYSIGSLDGRYLPGYAVSRDGIHWKRMDKEMNISPSAKGWDSLAINYPIQIKIQKRRYLFYNGNNFGEKGFGYAELV